MLMNTHEDLSTQACIFIHRHTLSLSSNCPMLFSLYHLSFPFLSYSSYLCFFSLSSSCKTWLQSVNCRFGHLKAWHLFWHCSMKCESLIFPVSVVYLRTSMYKKVSFVKCSFLSKILENKDSYIVHDCEAKCRTIVTVNTSTSCPCIIYFMIMINYWKRINVLLAYRTFLDIFC